MYRVVPIPFRALTVRAIALVAVLVAAAACYTANAESNGTPIVAAAASVQFALDEIIDSYYSRTGIHIRLSLGSSGNLSRQIRQGAPYQLFLSADEHYVRELASDGLTEGDGVLYSIGRLAIFIPHESPLTADGSLEDLRASITDGRLKRFAIANPEHAPYGRRAEEALRHAGLWEAIRARLIFGENVAQAAQFAASSNAQGGIVAYSLALSPPVSALGEFALIPADWHRPLRQRMVLVRGAGADARRFYEFLQQPPARVLFRKYGFEAPRNSD